MRISHSYRNYNIAGERLQNLGLRSSLPNLSQYGGIFIVPFSIFNMVSSEGYPSLFPVPLPLPISRPLLQAKDTEDLYSNSYADFGRKQIVQTITCRHVHNHYLHNIHFVILGYNLSIIVILLSRFQSYSTFADILLNSKFLSVHVFSPYTTSLIKASHLSLFSMI